MAYLETTEYESYGLAADTTDDWIAVASGMIDAYCRRAGVLATQYMERLRVVEGQPDSAAELSAAACDRAGHDTAGDGARPVYAATARRTVARWTGGGGVCVLAAWRMDAVGSSLD